MLNIVSKVLRPRFHHLDGQRGQAIILLAVTITVLLGVAGLAVDAGNAMYQRRLQQTGADSSAFAGTKLLQTAAITSMTTPGANFGQPFNGTFTGLTDDNVQAIVKSYITQNTYSAANYNPDTSAWYIDQQGNHVGLIGGHSIPPSARGVEVTSINTTVGVNLLTVLGFASKITVPAIAQYIIATPSFQPTGTAPLVVDDLTLHLMTNNGTVLGKFGNVPQGLQDLSLIGVGGTLYHYAWSDLTDVTNESDDVTKNCIASLPPGSSPNCALGGIFTATVTQCGGIPVQPPTYSGGSAGASCPNAGFSDIVNQPPGVRQSACISLNSIAPIDIKLPIVDSPINVSGTNVVQFFAVYHVTGSSCTGGVEVIHGYFQSLDVPPSSTDVFLTTGTISANTIIQAIK